MSVNYTIPPPLRWLDLTLPTPAGNLAMDEALLHACDEGTGAEVLRFWESPVYFVALGYGNSVATEVRRAACEAERVAILRRCTGGGTVVQGPGCLNYALALRTDGARPVGTVSSTNRFIMERNRAAVERIIGRPVSVRGHTDLALDRLKFSGNAQRRGKRALLFHGCFLLRFNLAKITEWLPMPSKQPDYRQDRPHAEFLTNLDVSADLVKAALRDEWRAAEPAEPCPDHVIASLKRDRYANDEWTFRF